MADTLVFLQLEHRGLMRMLSLLEQMCDMLERGEPIDQELLALVIDYFLDYPDTCHHPKEDAVLRQLRVRDPQRAERLLHVLGEHEELHHLTERLRELAVSARRRASMHTHAFVDELRSYTVMYRKHLEDEDREFFPEVREGLIHEDWDLIDFSIFDQPDPLYDERAEARFRRLREEIFEAAADDELEDSDHAN